MKKNMKKIIATALTALLLPAMGVAQDAEELNMELHEVVDALELTLEDDSFDMAAESDSTLDEIRGTFLEFNGTDQLAIAVQNGTSQGNTTIGGITGDNSISGNAFNDAAGLSFVVQNSGNNAVVNAAMVVNVSLTQ